MNSALQIWVGPILSLLGVLLGFIATAIFNHNEYQKQIKILEMKTDKQYTELQKQKSLEQRYALLESALNTTQGNITDEKLAASIYTQLRLEFIRISCLATQIMKKFDDYSNMPKIETAIYSMLNAPLNLQMNVLTNVLDVQIFLEEYNRDGLSKEDKKEILKKIIRIADGGNTNCYDAMNNSLKKMYSYKKEYLEQIRKFQEDGTIIMS